MYVRAIHKGRESPVEKGLPLQGTWTEAFQRVDLLDITKPYPFPLPRWILDWRIKEWNAFFIHDDSHFLFALLANFKLFHSALVFLYDKKTQERLRFRKIIPLGSNHLPRRLGNDSVTTRSAGFYLRIHDWLEADSIRIDINKRGQGRIPSFTAHAKFNADREQITPMAVSLLFNERRSMYSFKILTPVQGDISFPTGHIVFDPQRTSGLFVDSKGYFPFLMQAQWCNGMGFTDDNRRIGFSLSENQVKESYRNNENALWVDGELTPLPPVRITKPQGPESDWIIQDLEGMVDLTFTPREYIQHGAHVIISKAIYDMPIGFYNGMIVNSKGEQFPLRNMWGTGERLNLRM